MSTPEPAPSGEPLLPSNDDPSSPPPPEFPLPATLRYPATAPPELITQGAEGRLYKTTWTTADRKCALKHRPSKPYRHPVLDQRLTRHRILAEARILQRCRREGVSVPALYGVDEGAGVLALEWIEGPPVRVVINAWLRRRKEEQEAGGRAVEAERVEDGGALVGLMRRIGTAVGRLHKVGVIHGDLTTSNMMLRPWVKGKGELNGAGDELVDGDIVIIDFGLASQGSADEDRAVDLYVLERAFGSTHPRAEGLFSVVLDAYRETFKAAPVVLKKLEDVRMRGRKRTMLG